MNRPHYRKSLLHGMIIVLLATLVLSLSPMWGTVRVSGETIEVTTNADPNPDPTKRNLREAVAAAQTGDTITIDTTQVTSPINVGGVLDVGNRRLLIDLKELEVRALGGSRLFTVGTGGYLEIVNGTLVGSSVPLTGNGAIINSLGTLELENVTLTGGAVDGFGGAIYSEGAVFPTRVTVISNSAMSGGGIYVRSPASLNMRDSVVRDNNLTGASARQGAGIFAGQANLFNVDVINNNGAWQGGGAYLGASSTIDQSLFSNNTALVENGGVFASGGALYFPAGVQAKVADSALVNNTAHRGGGLSMVGGKVDVVNSTISGNQSSASGLSVASQADASAAYVGGGTLVASFVTLANNGGTFTNTAGVWTTAGGIFLYRNSVMDNAADNNCSVVDGGVLTDDDGNLDSGATCTISATDSVSSTAPLLSALTDGVHPLPPGSPALNTATADCRVSGGGIAREPYAAGSVLNYDQRSEFRPQPTGARCDRGSFELATGGTPGFVFSSVTGTEVREGEGYVEYCYSLTSVPTANVLLNVVSASPQVTIQTFDTATNGQLLFTPVNYILPHCVEVRAVDDATIETDPHFTLINHTVDASSAAEYVGITVSPLNIIIRDNDASIVVSVSDTSVTEGNAGTVNMPFTISLSAPPPVGETIVVNFTTENSSATAPIDYTALTSSVSFSGTTTSLVVNVAVNGDTLPEANEIFYLRLTSVSLGARLAANPRGSGIIFNDDGTPGIVLNPETLPIGQAGAAYNATLIASGGTPPYTYLITGGTFPVELTFNGATGQISGTVTGVGSATFTVTAVDATGASGQREYTLTFTLTGQADPLTPTATPPLTQDQINATQVSVLREQLGPPQGQIPQNANIQGLSVRTGPFIGASLINVARPGRVYDVKGVYIPPGGATRWYLIEYPVGDPALLQEGEVLRTQQGWVSGRYFEISGFVIDVPQLGNPFAGIPLTDTGVTGRTALKGNLYRDPVPDYGLVGRFDEGSTFRVHARTKVDLRDITYWMLITVDQTGQSGWTPYTEGYHQINGSFSNVPNY